MFDSNLVQNVFFYQTGGSIYSIARIWYLAAFAQWILNKPTTCVIVWDSGR
jgi:hypothetical protein